MAKVFISHSSKDREFAVKLASDLHKLGHEPWLDEWEIKVGECIISKIEHGISEADYVVVVLSPRSVESGWVEKEWKTKYWDEIKQNRALVLPVLIENCEIPPLLKTKKYADFRKNYFQGLKSLINAISPIIEKPSLSLDWYNETSLKIIKVLSVWIVLSPFLLRCDWTGINVFIIVIVTLVLAIMWPINLKIAINLVLFLHIVNFVMLFLTSVACEIYQVNMLLPSVYLLLLLMYGNVLTTGVISWYRSKKKPKQKRTFRKISRKT